MLTAALAITVFGGFAESRKAAFDEIEVHRINIVEPDGTLRLVISDKAKFPGSFVNGKEIARPDRHDSGLLFLNGEGTEMGGLTFDGWKDKNGETQYCAGPHPDTSAVLKMKGTQGRDRLVIKVAANGSPSIQFLDEGGRVASQLPAPN